MKWAVTIFDDVGEIVTTTIHDTQAEANRIARLQAYGCAAMINPVQWVCKLCKSKTYEDLRRSRGVCFDCLQDLYYKQPKGPAEEDDDW